jgi:hypothetical protein
LVKYFFQILKVIQISKNGPKSGPRASNRSQSIFHVTKRKRKTNVQHHSQADDLRACFKVPE